MKNAALATREREETTSVVNIEVARRGRQQLSKELVRTLTETAQAANLRAQADAVASLLRVDDQIAAHAADIEKHDQRFDEVEDDLLETIIPTMNLNKANIGVNSGNIKLLHRTQQTLADGLNGLYTKTARFAKITTEMARRHEIELSELSTVSSQLATRQKEDGRLLTSLDCMVHEQEQLRYRDLDKTRELEAQLAAQNDRIRILEARRQKNRKRPSLATRAFNMAFWATMTLVGTATAYAVIASLF